MILGIGVDMVSINEMRLLQDILKTGALNRMFTQNETESAKLHRYPEEYLASRFAVKEAVFKAVSSLLRDNMTFDLRIVETMNREDGSPYVKISRELDSILRNTDINKLHVSITTEKDMAMAFVIAER